MRIFPGWFSWGTLGCPNRFWASKIGTQIIKKSIKDKTKEPPDCEKEIPNSRFFGTWPSGLHEALTIIKHNQVKTSKTRIHEACDFQRGQGQERSLETFGTEATCDMFGIPSHPVPPLRTNSCQLANLIP
jgi:hypothetical protein